MALESGLELARVGSRVIRVREREVLGTVRINKKEVRWGGCLGWGVGLGLGLRVGLDYGDCALGLGLRLDGN